MTYKVFIKGTQDDKGNYIGGELVGTFRNEEEAWMKERECEFKYPHDLGIYMLRESKDDVFTIIKADGYYHIVDKATKGYCYGISVNESEAIKHKEWCEKYHTLGWYYDKL